MPSFALTLLSRARAVTASEWRDLARAQRAIVRAWARVRSQPAGALVTPTRAPEAALPPVDPASSGVVRRRAIALAWAVDRASAYGVVRATCLVRALALHALLEAERVDGAHVRVGVRRRNGRFDAHAWVELAGVALGEPGRERARFTPLAALAVTDEA